MAISVIHQSALASAYGSASLTYAHTVSSGDAIFVGVGTESNVTVSACTYNSETMLSGNGARLWEGGNDGSTGNNIFGALLLNPDVGSFNVAIAFTSAAGGNVSGAVQFTGVDQTIGTATRNIPAIKKGAGANANPSITATSQAGDLVIDTVVATFTSNIIVNAAQTSRVENDDAFGSSWAWGISTKDAAGSATTMEWSVSGGTSKFWSHCAAALVPAAGGAASYILYHKGMTGGFSKQDLTGNIRG